MVYKLFFAWQSEKDNTQKYIKKHLRKASKLFEEQGNKLDIIFYPAQDEAGSPSIPELIVKQIKESDVFIADLTTAVKLENGKEFSNANVMYELGIARAYLGENRIIMLVDKEFTSVENLAFDINHSRMTPFEQENENFYKDLYEYINKAIDYANNQRDILNYAMNDILSNLVIIYNNCFRMLSGYDNIIEIKEVSKELIDMIKKRFFLDIQISNNFEPMLDSMNESMKKIINSDIFDHNFKIKLVELMKAIEHYCFVFQKNSGSFFTQVEKGELFYYVMDSCATLLKVAVSDDEINKSVFFRNNTYLFSTKSVSICDCFDKRSIEKYLSNVQEVSVRMKDGLVTRIKDHKYVMCNTFYKINSDSEEVFTKFLVKIIILTESIVKELGLYITREEDGIEQNFFSFHRKNRMNI